ncbi:MAG: helix-turn-helix transcriptional regulator [Opitutales bacterium]|nr:helix-turn-helix transcriptional regulator [Opitutales bacterium]
MIYQKSPSAKGQMSPADQKDREHLFRSEMRNVLLKTLDRNERSGVTTKVPKKSGDFQKLPGMHYHFKPEIFIQLQGETRFSYPAEETLLKEEELLIIPPGIPHKEVIYPKNGDFRNLVVGFYSNTLSLHFAFEAAPQKPDIEFIQFFDTPNLDLYVGLANHLVEVYHSTSRTREAIIKGISGTLLASFLDLVETGTNSLNSDIGKVFQAKWIVREQIANPDLNVKMIANCLQCSADYLSHLFHNETGEKLIHYIQRIRIQGAIYALETTSLYVSEISWSSGYTDAAYFARIFKKFTGMSPADYRTNHQKKHQKKEDNPKSVYHDHDDYSHGRPFLKLD